MKRSRQSSDVDLATAAGDLLVGAEELEENLNLLDPAVGVLDVGRLDRNDWSTLYLSSLCILSAVNENTPRADLCE
jgi:hypothetical protein